MNEPADRKRDTSTARILVIAGSDSGGGAGIQADIKTITMLGGHAMTALTAVTAQNTQGVEGVHPVPTEFVIKQIDAVADDIGVDAVKIGMLGSAETANAVADRLESVGVPIVFDPVMVATSGARLADAETIAAFGRLMNIATVVTPNLPELATLSHGDDPVAAALRLVSEHRAAVLIKGGHDSGDALVDALIEEDNMTTWQGSRIATRDTHGTGCTMASAIALFLAEGRALPMAVDRAREFVRLALHGSPGLGQGAGPLGQQNVRLDIGTGPRLNQIAVPVDDYAESLLFYQTLGLKLIVDSAPDYARFETTGGGTLSLHRPAEDWGQSGVTVYLEHDDLDGEVDRLSRLGIRFEHGPMNQPWMWREARLLDPAGNLICLFKAGESRRYPPWRV